MKSFEIHAPDHGIRLNRFLARVAPHLPASLMYKALRNKDIRLNGARCEASARLSTGDVLTLYLDDRFLGAPATNSEVLSAKMLTPVYEDRHIAVLYKPRGLLSHSDDSRGGDTLIQRFIFYLFEKGEYRSDSGTAFRPALCNRLDRNTEGLVIAAKNAEALRAMQALIRANRIDKRYLCVTSGKPPADGTYRAYLFKDSHINTVSVSDSARPKDKEIITSIQTVARRGELTLLSVGLITGRTHQIRAHLAHLNAAILGDEKYGNPEVNRYYQMRHQALCAYSVTFHPDAEEDSFLYYLSSKTVALETVGFVRKYFPGY